MGTAEEVQEHPNITIDTGCEESADMVSDSAGMVAWKRSEPKWKDITSYMVMPYYHVVEFGQAAKHEMQGYCKNASTLLPIQWWARLLRSDA